MRKKLTIHPIQAHPKQTTSKVTLLNDSEISHVVLRVIAMLFSVSEQQKVLSEGKYLEALVDKPLVEHLLEDPPDRLHVPRVHCFVVVLEVDPSSQPGHDFLKKIRFSSNKCIFAFLDSL